MKPKDWIRIEDKKPRYGRRVLVCQTIGNEQFIRIAHRSEVRGPNTLAWFDDDGFDIDYVTHWMPIMHPSKKK